MFKTKNLLIFILLASTLIISACYGPVDPVEKKISDDISIRNFDSEKEFQEFIDNTQSNYYGGYYMNYARSESFDSIESISTDMAKGVSSPQYFDGSSDFSETNVQVLGIDEMDIIKTDGEYIYTINRNKLFIIKAYPSSDAEIISEIELKDNIIGLFIHDDVLAISGHVQDLDKINELGFSTRTSLTFLKLYDISNKENPELLKEYVFDGSYFNARLYEGIIYLSTNFDPYGRPHPMPIIMMDGVKQDSPVSNIYFYNTDYTFPSFVSIHSVRMDNQQKIDSKTITLEGSNHMYMSYENIYLTFRETINQYVLQQEILMQKIMPKLSSEDKEYIQRINDVDDDLLSEYEKQAKIMELIQRYVSFLDVEEQEDIYEELEFDLKNRLRELKYLEHTVVHKIKVDNGVLEFESANKVPGIIYGQFALDEYEGNLRIATTLNQGMEVTDEYPGYDWKLRSPSTNNVYVLDENMQLIGSLEGLAETESIFSARYVNDRLYLVTFRQVDPFFVIDLSNPENPKDLGELKITGYSRYLHPYDGNTIIGLGREGTESGTIKGIKISLFDVSDVSNPKELVTYVSEDSSSSSGAEWEHKAFLFSREKELLVIPVQNYDYRTPANNYAGALVFKINKEEIIPKGLISHTKGEYYYGEGVERSLYINDELYTKSSNLLRINNLNTLESSKNISLDLSKTGNIPIY